MNKKDKTFFIMFTITMVIIALIVSNYYLQFVGVTALLDIFMLLLYAWQI